VEIESIFSRDLAAEFAAGITEIEEEISESSTRPMAEKVPADLAAERDRHEVMEKVFQGKELVLSEQKKLKVTTEQFETFCNEKVQLILDNITLSNRHIETLKARNHQLSIAIARLRFDGGDTRAAEAERSEANNKINELKVQIQNWIQAGQQLEAFAQQAGAKIAKDNDNVLALEKRFSKMKTVQERRFQAKGSPQNSKQDIQDDLATYFPIDLLAERDELLKGISDYAKVK
jgi:hypothetical protein